MYITKIRRLPIDFAVGISNRLPFGSEETDILIWNFECAESAGGR